MEASVFNDWINLSLHCLSIYWFTTLFRWVGWLFLIWHSAVCREEKVAILECPWGWQKPTWCSSRPLWRRNCVWSCEEGSLTWLMNILIYSKSCVILTYFSMHKFLNIVFVSLLFHLGISFIWIESCFLPEAFLEHFIQTKTKSWKLLYAVGVLTYECIWGGCPSQRVLLLFHLFLRFFSNFCNLLDLSKCLWFTGCD